MQWRLHHEDGAWVLRNRHTDKYLGIEGEARDGTPVIAVDEPFHWHIVADEEDPSTFRCASLSLIASPGGFMLRTGLLMGGIGCSCRTRTTTWT